MKRLSLIFGIILLTIIGFSQTKNINSSGSNLVKKNADGNVTVTGNFVNLDVDSVYMPGAIAQFHRIDSIDVATAGSWITVKFDTLIANESTYGYNFNSDSTGFITSFSGDTRVQGCGHWIWRGADNANVKMYLRVLINSVEARCLQANDSRGKKTSDDGTLAYTGTIHHMAHQEIKLQYQVSNIDMDWEGSAVFDNPISFSINFEKMNDY